MKEIKCGIVEDLFVSYRDGMTTEETKEMLQAHLAECENCREKYAKILLEQEEVEKAEKFKGKQFQQKLLSYRAYGIGFFIGLFLPVLILIGLFLLRVLHVAIRDYFIYH